MIEPLVAALLGTFSLGLATWHIVRVVSHGSLFEPLRIRLKTMAIEVEVWGRDIEITRHRDWFWSWVWVGLNCRLCFETQVAIILTWGTLVTGLVVDPGVLPYAGWGFAFAIGPFLTAGWSEIIRRVECVEAPA